MALTVKHTVEFSNNRRTPSGPGTLVPTPSGATLQTYPIRAIRSNPPDPEIRGLDQLRDAPGPTRGTEVPREKDVGNRPGTGHRCRIVASRRRSVSVSVPPCRANDENITQRFRRESKRCPAACVTPSRSAGSRGSAPFRGVGALPLPPPRGRLRRGRRGACGRGAAAGRCGRTRTGLRRDPVRTRGRSVAVRRRAARRWCAACRGRAAARRARRRRPHLSVTLAPAGDGCGACGGRPGRRPHAPWRRAGDSNPRCIAAQRFSRPSHSAALSALLAPVRAMPTPGGAVAQSSEAPSRAPAQVSGTTTAPPHEGDGAVRSDRCDVRRRRRAAAAWRAAPARSASAWSRRASARRCRASARAPGSAAPRARPPAGAWPPRRSS